LDRLRPGRRRACRTRCRCTRGEVGTLSRPVLFHYTAQRPQLEAIARSLFAALRNGTLRPRIAHRYPLAAAADAHRDLEARRTTG
jgi:NADPH2:quinone reductase